MKTRQLSNQSNLVHSFTLRTWLYIFAIIASALLILSPGWKQALLSIIILLFVALLSYWLIQKSIVSYTLTATHFQQHLFKGGWVLKWSNISKIEICHYDNDGWQQPLPWIGIQIKHYTPYLESICPRIATEILLSQRALLYLGLKQSKENRQFEDIVLDTTPYKNRKGETFSGLQAMLANRMSYQRLYMGYDLFISANDLDRPIDEFVGLTRRYLAAVASETQGNDVFLTDDPTVSNTSTHKKRPP
ncbi:DUF2982 domain-containing protein [Vibrio sinensis]|uniref:DUF2982 domain-containing protein n=1 Tax=Vibrio sinensis TaxID=2302434 RepID=A0A3A6Q999_9VIBR|nr:DUF2982 domain-containing protein [Vibrio sinensis]RJX68399.1 DUF2982 domain-containing protein [Vibrio sinensis]